VAIVRLTVAPTEVEAEMVCGLLRTEGIECFSRPAQLFGLVVPVGGNVANPGGPHEVVVDEHDLAAARALLAAKPSE